MILKKFGLGLDQAYVFGDSMNDLSMFQYAAHTIAMGKSRKRSGTFYGVRDSRSRKRRDRTGNPPLWVRRKRRTRHKMKLFVYSYRKFDEDESISRNFPGVWSRTWNLLSGVDPWRMRILEGYDYIEYSHE